ncbi:C-C chemokine receptor type 8-like [Menidia menidia]
MADLNSTMVSFTINNSSAPLSPPSWDFRGPISAGILSLCFLLGVPGNIAVIILKPNWEHLCSLSQSLMLNLAISDLLCLLTLPLWIYYLLSDWIFGLVACRLLACFEYVCIYSSTLTVTVLSVHRYLLVVHQQRWLNKIGTRKLLALIWLVALVLSTPASVVRQLTRDHDRKRTRCSTRNVSDSQKLPVMLMEILVLSICLFVVAFAYFRVFKKVNEASFFNHAQTTRLVISITVTLFVLWIPFYSINVLGVAAISLQNERLWKSSVDIKDVVIALTFVNSCLNPLLYAFTSNYLYTVCCSCQPRAINGQISTQQGAPPAAEP